MTEIPVVFGAHGTTPKGLYENKKKAGGIQELVIRGRIKTIQTKARK